MSNDWADAIRDVIRIDDPQINGAEVVDRVTENLLAHSLDENIDFPQFAVAPPRFTDKARFPAALYYDLKQATSAYGQVWVELDPVESRIPLLARIKRAFHRLVVYYVNRLGERQTMVNGALLRALNQMVKTLDNSEAEVVSLRHQVAELRARLDRLERDGDIERAESQ